MAINKNIIKDALAEAKQIEQFAFESAKKALEESFAPQIEEAVLNSLKEMETVSEAPVVTEEQTEEVTNEDISTISETSVEENTNLTNPTVVGESNSELEMTTEQEEIFEVEGVSTPAPAPTDADMTAPTTTEPAADPMTDIETKLADMAEKIDSILSAINPSANSEGQVDVIDDENAGQEAPAAPAAPAPNQEEPVVSEEDMMFEIDEDFMNALSEMNSNIAEEVSASLSEMDDLDEIEIVAEEDGDDEEEEETVEEMKGVGNTVVRSAGNRQEFMKDKKHTGINEGVEKIKAQYESTIDELIKENAGLKQAVEEYKTNIQEFNDSFIELQKQINEMHVFNGKLAYANRLLSRNGFTAAEKIRIGEAFDQAKTVEDAKKLYTQFLNEMKSQSTTATQQSKDVKTAKPSVATPTQTSQTQTIFESEETKRMRKLAGLIKEDK